jgi:hypothetical protein
MKAAKAPVPMVLCRRHRRDMQGKSARTATKVLVMQMTGLGGCVRPNLGLECLQ